ncbi:uncharacterized protein IUM83_09580 [Phytophthora cinnamomi]|uniref:uncharacterized protein n=1 Tax=Phytophthora cinnamomi TaxID=4785 RepID=UPI003559745C|nr:hypothetical protein IUM83_09580 [Phytophthora cinnamomi]
MKFLPFVVLFAVAAAVPSSARWDLGEHVLPASKAASIQLFVPTPGRGQQRPPLQNGNDADKKINSN